MFHVEPRWSRAGDRGLDDRTRADVSRGAASDARRSVSKIRPPTDPELSSPETPNPGAPRLEALSPGALELTTMSDHGGDPWRVIHGGWISRSTRETSRSLRHEGLQSRMFHVEPPAFCYGGARRPRRPEYIGMFHVEPGRKSIGRWPRTRMPDEPDVSRGTGVRRRPGVGEARSGSVTCPVSLILHRVTDSSTTPRCRCIASACSHGRSTAT